MSVSWEVRLLLLQAALVLLAAGAAWMRGAPRFRSIWGLRFERAMASEKVWRVVHRDTGRMMIVLGIWFAWPFSTLFGTLWQIGAAALFSMVGYSVIYTRSGR